MKNKQKSSKNFRLVKNSSMEIYRDISFSTAKKHSSAYHLLLGWILAFAASLSTLIITNNFVFSDINYITVTLFSLIATTAFTLLISKSKFIKYLSLGVCVIILLFIVIKRQAIFDSFIYFLKEYLEKANRTSNIKSANIAYYDKNTLNTCLNFALSVWISMGTVISCVYRKDFSVLFLFTFPTFELGLYWGWQPAIIPTIVVLMCWVSILALNIVNHSANKAGRNNTFAIHKKNNTFYFTSPSGKAAFAPTVVRFTAIVTSTVFICTIIFSAVTGFVRPEKFDIYRSRIMQAADNFSMENFKDKNDKDNLNESFGLFGIKSTGSNTGGILGQQDKIKFSGKTSLKISTDKFNHTMYLKGYVGGTYNNNSWHAIPIDTKSDAYTIFKSQGKYPQDVNFLNMSASSDYGDNVSSINVKPIGASSKFIYAPYFTDYSGSNSNKVMKMCEESYLVAYKKNYTLSYFNANALFDETQTWENIPAVNWNSEDAYSSYSNFVNDKYLTYRNSKPLNKAYEEIKNNYITSEEYNYTSVCSAIKNYFQDNFSYTLSPGATPDNEDFIDYFLTKQKKGYCSYFATAGTQLLRMFGFPARYVEGYIVLPSQYNKNGIDIKDNSAHAWAEAYISGIGWLPAEFTPGYDRGNPNIKNKDERNDSSKLNSSSDTDSSSNESSSSKINNNTSSKSDTTSVTSSMGQGSSSSTVDGIGNHGSGSGSEAGNLGSSGNISPSIGVFMPLLIIAVVLLAVIIRRKILINKKYALISSDNLRERIKAIYKYTLKYLELINIKTGGNITDMQLYDDIIRQCSDMNIKLDEENLGKLFDTALKATMSDLDITLEEAEECEKTMNEILEKNVLPNINAYEKLKAKFILCIY